MGIEIKKLSRTEISDDFEAERFLAEHMFTNVDNVFVLQLLLGDG